MKKIADHLAVAALSAALLTLPACGGGSSSTMGRSAASLAKESQAESGRTYAIGPQFESQLEKMISQEVAALGGKENVPMELNRQVLLNINYFLNEARGFMTNGLSRGSKYIPMMKAIFRQKGLPEDLVYLALIESGFKTSAVSHASAVGPWQFIASTGRNYGLTINEWVDERMDPVKSTYAAADYLTTLHDMFNSWPLAIAAYNSGEGKILKGMKDHGVNNFWDMSSVGGHLAGETKLYVPSFLAATFIAKDPAAYGLTIEVQPPDQWEEVVVPTAVTFKEAASYCGTTVERLQELNPHLKKEATPPNETDFVLRIPAGSSQQFAKAYGKAGKGSSALASAEAPVKTAAAKSGTTTIVVKPSRPTLSTITHKVKSGDTLGSIAKRYGVTAEAVKKTNSLKSDNINVGQVLKIQSDLPLTAKKKSESGQVMVVENKNAPPRTMTTHTVASGENLGGIALKYNMSLRELVDVNKIEGTTIRPGQKLKVVAPPSAAAASSSARPASAAKAPAPAGSGPVYEVAPGDTVSTIAQKHGMKTKELMELNNLTGANIRPGQKIRVKGPAAKSTAAAPAAKTASTQAAKPVPAPAAKPSAPSGHTVASGENIGVIAQKYGLSPKELMAINNMDSPVIRVGQTLKVSRASAGSQSKPAAATYTVAEGDTLYDIARKNKVSVDELKKINQLNGDTLRLGQKLKLK